MMKTIRETYLGTVLLRGLVMLLPFLGWGQTFFDLPKPTQFVAGVPQARLDVVKELPNEFGDDEFMADPFYVTANKNGKIYVFDVKLSKVFMFNERYEFLGKFLQAGRGPSEIFPRNDSTKMIYAGKNGKFYINDCYNDKVLEFTESGEFLRDMKIDRLKLAPVFFPPVVDKNGAFYAYSLSGGIVDQFDNHMKVVHSFLKEELNAQFIYYRPDWEEYYKQPNDNFKKKYAGKTNTWVQKKIWLIPNFLNVKYDLTATGLLLIYLQNSSTIYLFNGKNLVRQFPVLVDSVLNKYKEDVDLALQSMQKRRPGHVTNCYMPLFSTCVVDQDEPYFYLQGYPRKEGYMLYKFDLSGKIVQTMSFPVNVVATLQAKINGLFYGITQQKDESYVVVMKSVDK